jgi:hypothetical protein
VHEIMLLSLKDMKNKNKAKNKKTLARDDTSPTESLDDVAKRVIAHIPALRDVDIV